MKNKGQIEISKWNCFFDMAWKPAKLTEKYKSDE